MKLCGCNEPCFENGEKCWGHLGTVMCLNLSETIESESMCRKDMELVIPYSTEANYQQLIKNRT